MFSDLYDAISSLWSSRWPEAMGEVKAVDVEWVGGRNGHLRLAVAYKFFVNDNGPYTGESFWYPAVFIDRRVQAAQTGAASAILWRCVTGRMIPANTDLPQFDFECNRLFSPINCLG